MKCPRREPRIRAVLASTKIAARVWRSPAPRLGQTRHPAAPSALRVRPSEPASTLPSPARRDSSPREFSRPRTRSRASAPAPCRAGRELLRARRRPRARGRFPAPARPVSARPRTAPPRRGPARACARAALRHDRQCSTRWICGPGSSGRRRRWGSWGEDRRRGALAAGDASAWQPR